MTTLAVMKTRINNELQRDSTDQELLDSILGAIAFYRRQRFNWNLRRATAATIAENEYYQVPPDFVEADSMILNVGNHRDRLTERTFYWIEDQEQDANYFSRPEAFAVQNGEFRLYPIPDQSYTLTLSYVRSLPEVSASAADSASNAWMTDGEELIRLHAKVDLLENRIRGPESFEEASRLRAREGEVLVQLRREYKRAQSSGRVEPSSIM